MNIDAVFSLEKTYATLISDSNVILINVRQGKRYTKRYYQKGILHIEVTLDHKIQDLVQIKIQKIY